MSGSKVIFFKHNHHFIFEKASHCMYNFDFYELKHYQQGFIAQEQ